MSDQQKPRFSYQAEMGFTHYELLKGLPSAVKPYEISQTTPLVYDMRLEGRVARMTISPETVRKIASMELPVTNMVIDFFDFDKNEYERFMGRFKRYLHRGGG